MARKRPTASNAIQPVLLCLDGGRPDADLLLTRAEAAALRRSAPLTHAALSEHLKAHHLPRRSGLDLAELPDRDSPQRHDGDVVA